MVFAGEGATLPEARDDFSSPGQLGQLVSGFGVRLERQDLAVDAGNNSTLMIIRVSRWRLMRA